MRYRERPPAPPEVEAFQWDGADWDGLAAWVDSLHVQPGQLRRDLAGSVLSIQTERGWHDVPAGCYLVVQRPTGGIHAASAEMFEALYEPVTA